jgi:hypothetical protein
MSREAIVVRNSACGEEIREYDEAAGTLYPVVRLNTNELPAQRRDAFASCQLTLNRCCLVLLRVVPSAICG